LLVKKSLNTRKSVKLDADGTFTIRLSEETVTNGSDINMDWLQKTVFRRISNHSNTSVFRLKKRLSKISDSKYLRIDLTAVRNSSRLDTLPFEPLSYELEFEIIPRPSNVQHSIYVGQVYEGIIQHINMVTESFTFHNRPLTEKKRREVITSYLHTIKDGSTVESALKHPKKVFIGPQPVTLERKHLQNPDKISPGFTSIYRGYTVTDKADGERYLLFKNETGNTYLINNRLGIREPVNCIDDLPNNTILDGEYITNWKNKQRKKPLFAIFDVYFYDGQNVCGIPSLFSRLDKLSKEDISNSVEISHRDSCLQIIRKAFWMTDTPGNISKCLKYSKTKDYNTDGLVFTPSSLAVGECYPGGGYVWESTWTKVFKWKPPEENTIDFLVRSGKNGSFDLYVGRVVSDNIKPYDFLSKKIDPRDFADKSFYIASLFNGKDMPPPIYDPNKFNDMMTKQERIYEFYYDKINSSWRPKKERKDKTELLFRQDFQIGGTANDYDVALQIWNTIKNPVHEQDLSDDKTYDNVQDLSADDSYYKRHITRTHLASKSMMDVHNLWIKGMFVFGIIMKPWREYSKKNGNTLRLLDMGCGRSGDADRWRMAGINHVLGIDASSDNIEGGREGAYARLLKKLSREDFPDNNKNFIYITGDLNCDITSSDAIVECVSKSKQYNPSDKLVAEHLWGSRFYPELGDHTYKFASPSSFDIISCQFALHYLWKNLDVLVDNVDYFLKEGGLFVGTCLNGQLVAEKLNESENGVIERFISSPPNLNHLLWRIRSKSIGNIEVGQEVDVYLESIGQYISEYLVDFDKLTRSLAAKGIHPYQIPGTTIKNGIYSFRNILEKEYDHIYSLSDECVKEATRIDRSILTSDEKFMSFSELNVCFAFIKKNINADVFVG
jgi:SAM-dependent methyltransferase